VNAAATLTFGLANAPLKVLVIAVIVAAIFATRVGPWRR